MLQQKKWMLWILTGILALSLVITGVLILPKQTAAADEEEMEIVGSYPYTTVTRKSVNLRASRSTRSAYCSKISGSPRRTACCSRWMVSSSC